MRHGGVVAESFKLEVEANLAAVIGRLRNDLQAACNLVAAGTNCSATLRPDQFEAPNLVIRLSPARNLKWDEESGRAHFAQWVVRNGLRDAVEAMSTYLESIYQVLWAWDFIVNQPAEGYLDEATIWAQKDVAERDFSNAEFKKKVASIRDLLGPLDQTDSAEMVLSIHRLRNCLVHRNGKVGKKHARSGVLRCQWCRLYIKMIDPDGEHEVSTFPLEIGPGSRLLVRSSPITREWKIGDTITLELVDFVNVCWTLLILGNQLVSSVEKFGISHGVHPARPQGAPPLDAFEFEFVGDEIGQLIINEGDKTDSQVTLRDLSTGKCQAGS